MSSLRDRPCRGAGSVALVALFAVAALAGCGSSGSAGSSSQATVASSGSTAAAASSTGTKSTTSASASTSKHASAKTTKSPAADTTKAAAPQSGARLLRQFTGSGNTRLGTIVVSSPQVLAWSAQHPPIQIFTSHGFMVVSSHASSGSVQLAQGTYTGLRVASHAGWSITLRTRSR